MVGIQAALCFEETVENKPDFELHEHELHQQLIIETNTLVQPHSPGEMTSS